MVLFIGGGGGGIPQMDYTRMLRSKGATLLRLEVYQRVGFSRVKVKKKGWENFHFGTRHNATTPQRELTKNRYIKGLPFSVKNGM